MTDNNKIDFEDFTKWVAKQIFDDEGMLNGNETDTDLFCEVACRKLVKLGLVEVTKDEYRYIHTD